MSHLFLSANQIEPAWQVLQAIPLDQRKEVNWEGMIIASTNLGRLDIANIALQQVRSPLTYLQRMGAVARANLRKGQTEMAIAILDRMAAQINPTQMQSLYWALQELAILYGQVGVPEKGLKVLPSISDVWSRTETEKHLSCYRRS
jgi:hypothetical protein